MRRIHPNDIERIQWAIASLKDARLLLRESQAGHAADYVARALKSAEGALRHAQGLHSRQATPKTITSLPEA